MELDDTGIIEFSYKSWESALGKYAMALPDEEQDRFWNLCKDEAEYRADRASIYKVYVETL